MPQAEGGYVSLGGESSSGNGAIYNTTTEPTAGSQSVFESVKRAIGQVVGNGNGQQQDMDDLLVQPPNGRPAMIVGSRDWDKSGKTLNPKMPSAPSANNAEEARLLGTMPIDPMDDIELRSVQLQFPNARGSIIDACDQRRVPTDKGDILVAVQGDTAKPAIMTYHDLGLNFATSFAGFFNYPVMRGLLDNFCVYHVTAPGQEEGAATLPEDYVYPTMDELASQLLFVMSHFGLKSVIGFGVGAGANILARFALSNPDKVGAICLINCVSTASGWIEWGYQSFNARFLRTKGMTQGVIDYLMWHHFGRNPEERNHDLVQMYKQHFEHGVNPTNLAMFINSYIHRNDLNIARTPPGTPGQTPSAMTLKMPVINITGALSPHVDDTVTLNGRLDPTNSTWMKISDCAMVMEEQPGKLSEAFRLFLQGEGYATPLSSPATTPPGTKNPYATVFYGAYQQQQQQQQKRQLGKSANPNNNNSEVSSSPVVVDIENKNRNSNNNSSNGNNKPPPQQQTTSGTFQSDFETDMDTDADGEADIDFNNIAGHNLNGTIYTGINFSSNKIRITENPIPEPVSC